MFFSEGNRVRLLVDYPDGNQKLPAMSVGTVVRDREVFDEVPGTWMSEGTPAAGFANMVTGGTCCARKSS